MDRKDFSFGYWLNGWRKSPQDTSADILCVESGNPLGCHGALDLLAWPECLTLTAELTPSLVCGSSPVRHGPAIDPENLTFDEGEPIAPPAWTDAELSVRLMSELGDWHAEKRIADVWQAGERQRVTLTCSIPGAPVPDDRVSIQVSTPGQTWPVTFSSGSHCMTAKVTRLQRTWQTGYTDIRDYDELTIVLKNLGKQSTTVPFLLDFTEPGNITGLCPILCDEEGAPTGIPVQLSKDWHYHELGEYLRAYALLPALPGASRYRLRIAYGFYGTLPSASHAQLSLVGWGRNGRWDQLAIGCWGETMCLDMDMSATDVAITDVRMLMTRNGPQGRKWSWTDAGWGGDWLGVHDAKGNKLAFTEMKTAYLTQGPCLTEVQYNGCYGPHREVDVAATVRTLRTDDYARTFHMLDYAFHKRLTAGTGWLFKMGRTNELVTPQIGYGNGTGLIAEHTVPLNLKPAELLVDNATLSGEGPWWVAFPGVIHTSGKNWGTGSRALVIRSYRALFDGKTYNCPTISMPVHNVQKDGRCDLDLLLVPPDGVTEFKPGDTVEMDLQWITLPRVADDYYGPNEAFRTHLAVNPRSWKTVYREARGNDLNVTVDGGVATHTYPIIIQASQPEITVDIQGGVGAVPIRFDGLETASGYVLYQDVDGQLVLLDQSVHGNDYWQTVYDAGSNTYEMSFNLPLDGMESSKWVLKQTNHAD